MRGREYWEKRSLEDKKRSVNVSERFINRELKRDYNTALKEIQEALNQLYQSFADQEHITLAEAKRRLKGDALNASELDALEKMLFENRKSLESRMGQMPEDVVAVMEKRMADMEKQIRRLSKKGYMSHLELSEMQVQNAVLHLSDCQQVSMYGLLEKEYRDGYFRGVFEVQQGMEAGFDFTAPDEKAVRKAVMNAWSKRNFSEAIWGHEKQLSRELRDAVTVGLIRGDGIDQMTKRVTNRLEVSASNARRLVRTETAHIHEQAAFDAYRECGITEYQFLATLDRRTSRMCQTLDGKVFKLEDARVGENYPPIHPNCRSTTVPQPGTSVSRRIARGADGRNYHVTGNITYEEWYKELPESDRARMRQENKADRSRTADKKQYEQYRAMLGKALGSYGSFRKKKYGDPAAFKVLQKQYQSERYLKGFRERLQDGKVGLSIQRKKQEEHTQGTKAFKNRLKQALASHGQEKKITPQSFLYKDVDAQGLVDRYSGTGILDYSVGSGTVKEYVEIDKPAGRYYNIGRKRYVETKRVCIIYNNKGTHVFPVKER